MVHEVCNGGEKTCRSDARTSALKMRRVTRTLKRTDHTIKQSRHEKKYWTTDTEAAVLGRRFAHRTETRELGDHTV